MISRQALAHDQCSVVDRYFKLFSDRIVEQNVSDAQKRRTDMSGPSYLVQIPLGPVNGDRKPDILRSKYHGGVDADHISFQIDQRTTRIARIDRGIRLD